MPDRRPGARPVPAGHSAGARERAHGAPQLAPAAEQIHQRAGSALLAAWVSGAGPRPRRGVNNYIHGLGMFLLR